MCHLVDKLVANFGGQEVSGPLDLFALKMAANVTMRPERVNQNTTTKQRNQ